MPTPNQERAAERLAKIESNRAAAGKALDVGGQVMDHILPGFGTATQLGWTALMKFGEYSQADHVEQLRRVARGESDDLPPDPEEGPHPCIAS